MQMRARGLSGISAFGNAFSTLDLHAFRNQDSLEVGISGLISETMVDYNRISIVEQIESHGSHDTVPSSIDRISRFQCEVESGMHSGLAGNRVGPVAERAGKAELGPVRNNRHHCRNTRCHVSCTTGKCFHVIERLALHEGLLREHIQTDGGLLQQ